MTTRHHKEVREVLADLVGEIAAYRLTEDDLDELIEVASRCDDEPR